MATVMLGVIPEKKHYFFNIVLSPILCCLKRQYLKSQYFRTNLAKQIYMQIYLIYYDL